VVDATLPRPGRPVRHRHRPQLERIFAIAHPISADGPVVDRVASVVAQRARIYEAITSVRRAALAQEPFSTQAVASRDRILALARAELQRVFAGELASAGREGRDLLEALDAAASWQVWEALRSHQGLSQLRARKVLERLVLAVLTTPDTSERS